MRSERRRKLDWLHDALVELDRQAAENDTQNLKSFAGDIFEILIFAYESFDDFVADFLSYGDSLRSIDSLWSTYRARGYESASYIEENFLDGVVVAKINDLENTKSEAD
ncbi:hypothetical protein D3C77_283700 [compost metagenome]